jgi:hypothetical protein
LCVMTQGFDMPKQAVAIKQVATLIYNQVSSQIGGN